MRAKLAAEARVVLLDLRPRTSPETLLQAAGLAAWATLALGAAGPGFSALCLDPSSPGEALARQVQAAWRTGAIAEAFLGWAMMALAMGALLSAQPLRHVMFQGYRRSRTLMAAAFAGAWAVVWLAAGAIPIGVLILAALVPNGVEIAAWTAIAAAVLWALTPLRQRALRRCHRTSPLAPGGAAGAFDSARFGAAHAGGCILICGPLMAALAVSSHALTPMIAATAWLWFERGARPPGPVTAAAVTAILGIGAQLL